MKRKFILLIAVSLTMLVTHFVDVTYAHSQVNLSGLPILNGTTGSFGGGALLVGGSVTGTASVTGASPGMPCVAATTDGTNIVALGATMDCTVTSSNTVTVTVTAIVALTPPSKAYNVRVIQ